MRETDPLLPLTVCEIRCLGDCDRPSCEVCDSGHVVLPRVRFRSDRRPDPDDTPAARLSARVLYEQAG